jgi:phytoene/squalene synthetase
MTAASAARARMTGRAAVRAHDENFPVAFRLAPGDVRADMGTVYAFCRATDDIGDEGSAGPAERLEALGRWEADLRARRGDLPAVVADLAERRQIPLSVFARLIEANRMDQRRSRWDTRTELIDYCRHSATPVGEMVLGVLGYRDPWRIGMSDETCIGL